jgi:Fe-S-cluster containining protein
MPEFSTLQLRADLAQADSAAQFDDAARAALAAFDGLNSEGIARTPKPLACRAGCSLCCSLRVDVFAHEVFPIVEHIRRHWSADEIAALMSRLAGHAQTVLTLTPFEHATRNVPCALLGKDGWCSVYAARPQSCRRHHSQDLPTCQYTYDHPTDLETPAAHDRALFRALTEAMVQNIEAYAEFGFDQTIYELGTALQEALTDPASWRRWRNHEPAFRRASTTPAE